MGTRGPKSGASLGVVVVGAFDRPPPPSDLSEAEAEEWRGVTARMPPDWFPRETQGLLGAYCGHRVTHRNLCAAINAVPVPIQTEDLGALDQLLRMRDREARAMTTLATKLRITNQSRYDPAKANTRAKAGGSETGKQLWE